MQGVDKKWRITTDLRSNYPQLSPGDYRFEVRLYDEGRVGMTPISSVQITIRPYWADTWWFRIGLVVSLLLALGISLKLRYDFVRKRDRLASENAIRLLELEAKALNAQMNPHFIFNSLNAIQYLMNAGEKDKANIYLASFGKLIRLNLEAAEKSSISLEEEIDRLAYYLSLEKLRLPNQVSYDIEVDPNLHLKDVDVPCMILQPFVENAIWHGILPAGRPGTVRVVVTRVEDEIRISIRDNGVGMARSLDQTDPSHTSMGIDLVRRRLKYAFPEAKEPLRIKSLSEGVSGTEVEIVFPLQ